jgi:hypothetical protein
MCGRITLTRLNFESIASELDLDPMNYRGMPLYRPRYNAALTDGHPISHWTRASAMFTGCHGAPGRRQAKASASTGVSSACQLWRHAARSSWTAFMSGADRKKLASRIGSAAYDCVHGYFESLQLPVPHSTISGKHPTALNARLTAAFEDETGLAPSALSRN